MDEKAISKYLNLNKFNYHTFLTIAKEKRKIYEDGQETEERGFTWLKKSSSNLEVGII